MKLCHTIEEIRAACRDARKAGKTVGLVPTMGALHAGHASLIKAASTENSFVVVSVFVNPTQFAPTEDLSTYPRTLEADCRIAKEMGAQAVFAPSDRDMYLEGAATWVEVIGPITGILCGKSRPTHFRGVTTVVNKLFNIVQPDRAYFGQKDGQQAQIIRRMAEDLFMPLEIRIMPIVREEDGVALSSRNIYLTPGERTAALVLSKSLNNAKQLVEKGERQTAALRKAITDIIKAEPLAAIDYVELYSFPDLTELGENISGQVFIALAVRFGKTRLIDNIVVDCK